MLRESTFEKGVDCPICLSGEVCARCPPFSHSPFIFQHMEAGTAKRSSVRKGQIDVGSCVDALCVVGD